MREKRFNTIADFGIRKRLFKLHTKSNIGFPTPYIAVVMSTFGWVLVFIYFILHLTSKSEKVFKETWIYDTKAATFLKEFGDWYYFSGIVEKKLDSSLQILIISVLGFSYLLFTTSLGIYLIFPGFRLTRLLTRALYSMWFVGLVCGTYTPGVPLVIKGISCSRFLDFGQILNVGEVGLCENFRRSTKECFGFFCLLASIAGFINTELFCSLGINFRIKDSGYGRRRTLLPEMLTFALIWTRSILFRGISDPSITLSYDILWLILIILVILYTPSFTHPLSKDTVAFSFIGVLAFYLVALANTTKLLKLDHPLIFLAVVWLCLGLLLVVKGRKFDLEILFQEVERIKESQKEDLLSAIEVLVLLQDRADGDPVLRAYLYGYVDRFQDLFDRSQVSFLNFSRLASKRGTFMKGYSDGLKYAILGHINEKYIQAIKRFPNFVVLRLSFASFLHDYSMKRNLAYMAIQEIDYLEETDNGISFSQAYMRYSITMWIHGYDLHSDGRLGFGDQKQIDQNAARAANNPDQSILEPLNGRISENPVSGEGASSKQMEEYYMLKTILSIRKGQLSSAVVNSIQSCINLWRELQGDSPISYKVKEALFVVEGLNTVVETIWKGSRRIFIDYPPALFDYGLFNIVVYNRKSAGFEMINQAKRMTKKAMELRFHPKNQDFGLNLDQCSDPVAYLQMKKGTLSILDCNHSFAALLKKKKNSVKKSNFFSWVPEKLNLMYYQKMNKKTKPANKLKEFVIPILINGANLRIVKMYLTMVKDANEIKIFMVKLSQDKHVYPSAVAIFDKKGKMVSANQHFREVFSLCNASTMGGCVSGATKKSLSEKVFNEFDYLNKEDLQKHIKNFFKKKAESQILEAEMREKLDPCSPIHHTCSAVFTLELTLLKKNQFCLTKIYKKRSEAQLSRTHTQTHQLNSAAPYDPKSFSQSPNLDKSIAADTMNSRFLKNNYSYYKDLQQRFCFRYMISKGCYFGGFMDKEKIKSSQNFAEVRNIIKASLLAGLGGALNLKPQKFSLEKKFSLDPSKKSTDERQKERKVSKEKAGIIIGYQSKTGFVVEKKVVDYAKGIRTMRLNEAGRLVERFLEDDEEDSQESDRSYPQTIKKEGRSTNKPLRHRQKSYKKRNDELDVFEASSYFKNLQKSSQLETVLRSLYRTVYARLILLLVLLFVTAFSSLSFLTLVIEFGFLKGQLVSSQILVNTINVYAECSDVVSQINNLVLLKKDVYPENLSKMAFFEHTRANLLLSVTKIGNLSQALLDQINSAGQNEYSFLLTEKKVKVLYGASSNFMSFRDSLSQLKSAGLSLYNLEESEISLQNSDFQFIVKNAINGVQAYITESVKNQYSVIPFVHGQVIQQLDMITTSMIVVSTIFCLAFLVVIYLRLRFQDKIVDLFYGFTASDCKKMLIQCEKAIRHFKSDEFGEGNEDDLELLEELGSKPLWLHERYKRRNDFSEIVLVSRIKKKAASTSELWINLVWLAPLLITTTLFFVGSNRSFRKNLDESLKHSTAIYKLVKGKALLGSVMTAVKTSAVDQNLEMLGESPAIKSVLGTWRRDEGLVRESLNKFILDFEDDTNLMGLYDRVYEDDSCKFFEEKKEDKWFRDIFEVFKCQEIYDKAMVEGISLTMVRHLAEMNDLLRRLDEYCKDFKELQKSKASSSSSSGASNESVEFRGRLKSCVTQTQASERDINLYFNCELRDPIFQQTATFEEDVLKRLIGFFEETVWSHIMEDYADARVLEFSVLTVFLVFLLVIMLGVWVPYNFFLQARYKGLMAILSHVPFWMVRNNDPLKVKLMNFFERKRGIQFADYNENDDKKGQGWFGILFLLIAVAFSVLSLFVIL